MGSITSKDDHGAAFYPHALYDGQPFFVSLAEDHYHRSIVRDGDEYGAARQAALAWGCRVIDRVRDDGDARR